MTLDDSIVLAQGIASGAMCGIVWFVQVVHYPLFASRGGDERAYALENRARTARVVIPFMLAEGVAATVIAWAPPPGIPRVAAVAGLALVAAAWLSTALVQMPLHARLAREGHVADVVAALVRSNRLRTVIWSLRAALAAWMLRVAA